VHAPTRSSEDPALVDCGAHRGSIVVPVLGWAHAGSRDWVVGIGPLHLPRIMAAGSKLGHELGDIHGDLAMVLAVTIALHVAAGVYHQFIRKDDTLLRMM
jgi:cytochrome b561